MCRFIKKMYYRKLFLRIYFSHLNHPNQKDPEYAFTCAAADFARIKTIFENKQNIAKSDDSINENDN